jgi:hypothetical protein
MEGAGSAGASLIFILALDALGYGISRRPRNYTFSSLGHQARSLAWRLFVGGELGVSGCRRASWLLNEAAVFRV